MKNKTPIALQKKSAYVEDQETAEYNSVLKHMDTVNTKHHK